jgi:hypothetical protein
MSSAAVDCCGGGSVMVTVFFSLSTWRASVDS